MNQDLFSSSFNEKPDSAFTHLMNLDLNYSVKELTKKYSSTEKSDDSTSDDDKNKVSNQATEKKKTITKVEFSKESNNQAASHLTTEAKVAATATICMPFNIVKTK
ncbi:hypothetical protein [Jiulongibacter sediminis]|uniref:Uncharacterized protein n=1 Tax=Jiulongibacter sediminis TaxID=1605367 RepID=A0A0P7C5C1_9BACT|nr:hypothetical protein [Jiulongibacter sediminis]KPM49978.1 hypothetical protein AFM12_05325 [Jiulongibacter sediminis]TBX27010.1 hypothetical protein TK44_05330 [Jiulongibacter sediminis]